MMKAKPIYFLLFVLMLKTIPFVCFGMDAKQNLHPFFLLDQRTAMVVPLLDNLFHVLHLEYDGTLKGAVDESQKKFLRPAQSERWDIQNSEGAKEESLAIYRALGMVHTRTASQDNYTYAVILGATLPNVRNRIELLKKEWLRGVRFKGIVILSGERPLRDSEHQELTLAGHSEITSEPAMVRFVFDNAALPPDIKRIPLTFITGQAKPNAARATTADAIDAWLAANPLPGTILAFSSQPVTFYQDAVLKRLLPETFSIETIGEQAPDSTPLGVYTDTIARWLFEEYNRYNREKSVDQLLEGRFVKQQVLFH